MRTLLSLLTIVSLASIATAATPMPADARQYRAITKLEHCARFEMRGWGVRRSTARSFDRAEACRQRLRRIGVTA
jgi:hypothetical protein